MKKLAVVTLSVLLPACVVSVSLAQNRQRIAVMNFQSNNVSKYVSNAVSEMISTEMAKKNDVQVIERSQMGQILEEQGLQMTGCTDSSCAVQVGKLLSARKILIGTVSKLGNNFTIVSRVVDVEKGSVDFADSERCAKEDDVEAAARILAVKLVNRIAGKSYALPSRSYEPEEQRNKLSLAAGYRYGMMKGIARPTIRFTSPGTAEIVSHDIDAVSTEYLASVKYDITGKWSAGMNFSYRGVKTGTTSPSWRR